MLSIGLLREVKDLELVFGVSVILKHLLILEVDFADEGVSSLCDLVSTVMLDLLFVIIGLRGGKEVYLTSFAQLRDFVGVVSRKEVREGDLVCWLIREVNHI